jgi:hypothetical protein
VFVTLLFQRFFIDIILLNRRALFRLVLPIPLQLDLIASSVCRPTASLTGRCSRLDTLTGAICPVKQQSPTFHTSKLRISIQTPVAESALPSSVEAVETSIALNCIFSRLSVLDQLQARESRSSADTGALARHELVIPNEVVCRIVTCRRYYDPALRTLPGPRRPVVHKQSPSTSRLGLCSMGP